MRKLGGIIAILAGIIGIFAGLATLMMGGAAGAVDAKGASTVVGLGFGGVFFSFLVIISGAVGLGAETKKPGVFLIACSIAGAVLGGTFVAVCMVLALIGGFLVLAGAKPRKAEMQEQPAVQTIELK